MAQPFARLWEKKRIGERIFGEAKYHYFLKIKP